MTGPRSGAGGRGQGRAVARAIPLALLALCVALSPAIRAAAPVADARSAALDAAGRALEAGDFDRAEALALAQASPPRRGAALFLAGLARFRAGRHEEALAAFEAAGRATDRPEPGLWHFDTAACLYEMGRFAEAEAEFERAAQASPALSPVALANAGFAALDAGALDRAAAFAGRAQAAGAGAPAPLVDDLLSSIGREKGRRAADEHRAALAAFDAGRFAEAREGFLRAAALAPEEPRSRIMAAAAALGAGSRDVAERELASTLGAMLAPDDAAIAARYLVAARSGAPQEPLQGAPRAAAVEPSRVAAHLRLGGGFDSDALQSGLLRPDELAGSTASAASSALSTAELGLGLQLGTFGAIDAGLAYELDQLAYLATSASDRSFGLHRLELRLSRLLGGTFRAGLTLAGQLELTGLSGLRLLQATAGAEAWAELAESTSASLRVSLAFAAKSAPAEFDYLSGQRLEAAATQSFRFSSAGFELGLRARAELIGQLRATLPAPLDGVCPPACPAQLVEPFGHLSGTAWASAALPLSGWLTAQLWGSLEARSYRGSDQLWLQLPTEGLTLRQVQRRADLRWSGGAAAVFAPTPRFQVRLKLDLLWIDSNLSGSSFDQPGSGRCGAGARGDLCAPVSVQDTGSGKQVVSLDTGVTF